MTITDEMAARFHLPPIADYEKGEAEYYHSFLAQSDYVAAKIAESAYLGEKPEEDCTEILQARKFARQRINEIEEANNGETFSA